MIETTRPKPFVFVLMPFSPEFDDTYRLAIKPACEKAGAYAERVDEQIFDGSILQRIYNQIAKADLVLSDLTGKNPNVFYETGYAHALGKRTLLLTRNADDIPFDLKHFSHIIYEGRLSDLIPEIERRVRWYIENPEKNETTPSNVLLKVNSVTLVENTCIQISSSKALQIFDLTIDIHNQVDRDLRELDCQIGLVSPEQFDHTEERGRQGRINMVKLDDGLRLHLPGKLFSLLPSAWDSITLEVGSSNLLHPGEEYSFAVRVFTESGSIDFPFSVIVKRS